MTLDIRKDVLISYIKEKLANISSEKQFGLGNRRGLPKIALDWKCHMNILFLCCEAPGGLYC